VILLKIKLSFETLLKAFIWEGLGLILIYLLTHSLAIGLVYVALRIMMYYVFERLWKHSRVHFINGISGQKKI
jgi:uncharacterized membrane protein